MAADVGGPRHLRIPSAGPFEQWLNTYSNRASHATQVTVNDFSTTPTIQIDHPQPLIGIVNLSIAGASSATSVQWFVDLNAIGTCSTAPSFSQSWDTSTVTNGSHLLIAQVEGFS